MKLNQLMSFDDREKIGPPPPRQLFFMGYWWNESTKLISKEKNGNCCGLRANSSDEFYQLAELYSGN